MKNLQKKWFKHFLSFFTVILSINLVNLLTTSCSMIQKVGVRMAAPAIYQASPSVQKETNWDMFKAGTPGNIKLIEGLLSIDLGNKSFLVTLMKAYSGYAFVVNETEYLEDLLLDKDNSYHRIQAIENHSMAMKYADIFLQNENILYKDLFEASKDAGQLMTFLDQKLDSNSLLDLEAMFFMGQSLVSLINLQKTNYELIGQINVAKGLFDWVCHYRPDFYDGGCDIFYAAYEAARPKMLGGNPELGKALFEKAILKYPHNHLVKAAYVQFSIFASLDQDAFKKQVEAMKSVKNVMEQKLKVWNPPTVSSPQAAQAPWLAHLNLYNETALRRFEIFIRLEKKIF